VGRRISRERGGNDSGAGQEAVRAVEVMRLKYRGFLYA
jgi:hypothetical protein